MFENVDTLFIAKSPHSAQVEFASALRMRGQRTALLTVPARTRTEKIRAAFDRAVFSDYIPALDSDGQVPAEVITQIVANQDLRVECLESTRRHLLKDASSHPGISRTRDASTEYDLMDKWTVHGLALSVGVPVPMAWLDPREATGPVMLKPRVSSGGVGVRALSDDELKSSAKHLADTESSLEVFYEEQLTGPVETVSGVAANGSLVEAVSYTISPLLTQPNGPAASITTSDQPEMVAAIGALLRSVGYTGLFAAQHIRDQQGVPRLIDLNLRLFGPWAAIERAGVPVVDGYLYAMGRGPRPHRVQIPVGRIRSVIRVDRFRWETEDRRAGWQQLRRLIRLQRPWMGHAWARWTWSRAVLNAMAFRTGRAVSGEADV